MTMHKDVVTGALSIALGAALLAGSFVVRDFAATGVGAGFMPRVAAGLFLLLGAILLVETLRRAPAAPAPERRPPSGPQHFGGPAAVLLSAALMAAYIGLLASVGFVITTAVYVFCQTLILAKGERRRLVLFGIVALATAGVGYELFVHVFQVMLPAGVLG